MNLLPTQEQNEIISVIRDFLANEVSVRRYQDESILGAAYSADLWQKIVAMGWFGISQSEAVGGAGLGLVDEALLARESGRQLVSPSVLASSAAIHLARVVGNEDLLKMFINGDKRAALALPIKLNMDDGAVSGELQIFDGDAVDYLYFCNGRQSYLIDAADLATRQIGECIDESVRIERATLLAVPPVLQSKSKTLIDVYALLLAGNLVGIAEAARDQAAAYAKEREQFGKAIAQFQSINHLCADMAVAAEAVWALLAYTALAISDGLDTSDACVASLVLLAKKTAIENARASIQVHGGVGFTVEYDAHLYPKRTHVYQQLLAVAYDDQTPLIDQTGTANEVPL